MITLTAKEYGIEANSFTLAESTAGARITKSGALLTGGVEGRFYTLPADFSEMIELKYGVKTLTPQQMTSDYYTLETGTPWFWFNYGAGRIGMDTPPDGRSAFNAEIVVVPYGTIAAGNPFPVLTSTGSDVPINIPDQFCMILVYGACVRAMGSIIADTVDGLNNRLSYCVNEKERLTIKFIESMVTV